MSYMVEGAMRFATAMTVGWTVGFLHLVYKIVSVIQLLQNPGFNWLDLISVASLELEIAHYLASLNLVGYYRLLSM